MPGSFFDTNTLLYVAGSNSAKADRAEELIRGGGAISVQVLNELANVTRRKMRLGWPDTRALLATFRALLEVKPITVEVHDRGLALAERHRLSTYDAMIVASALEAGCTTLWSEDMQHNLLVDDQLRILNPFHP